MANNSKYSQKISNLPYIEEIKPFLKDSDHIDIKTIEGMVSLREFLASMMSYQPLWLVFLFRIRAIVARILGLEKQIKLQWPDTILPEDISFTSGGNVRLFIVIKTKEDQYWISETPEDKHLRAYIGVVVESLDSAKNRFHVITIVFYKHWTGPVYFNLIRPFHHLVVRQMIRAGVSRNSLS